ncbi:hypothetical protein CQW23_27156 [Capsicum baccatum]|uniref:DYW domain-containing protein n=1 Tax=Capsicum baccatum TaxID=33114 RepID=A0A2G2VD11_CAPBA|nr:hypothetical protein CQW23_27156 [Capsicum baccatum]
MKCTLPFSSFTNPFRSENYLYQCNQQIQRLFKIGKINDARKMFDEMPQRDAVSWNSMISGYCHNGLLNDARALFDVFQGKNIRTWTSMLSGYAKNGRFCDAVDVFEAMPEKNVVSYNAMLSGYLGIGDFVSARKVFDEMGERNVASWNAMINGYVKGGRMREAHEMFDVMPDRNEVSYTIMISGCVGVGEFEEAWRWFVDMRRRGEVRPDQKMFLVALSVVIGLDNVVMLANLVTLAMKMGYSEDVVVVTAILNAFTQIGNMDMALKFFENLPEKNEYSWTTMISALSQCGRLEDAVALYRQVPEQTVETQTAMMTAYAQSGRIVEARQVFNDIRNPNVLSWNALLAGYMHNGMIEEAEELFKQMPTRNVASWAAMISGLMHNAQSVESLELMAQMHRLGNIPSDSSFTSALLACANIGDIEVGRQIHSLSFKAGCQYNPYVGNGLITMYAKCKNLEDDAEALGLTRSDIICSPSIPAGHSYNFRLEDAVRVFQQMHNRDVVSWTAVISAYVQGGRGEIALELFLDMFYHGIKPNELTVTSLLSATGSLGAKKLGQQLHVLTFKLGMDSQLFIGNALSAMYFKCGSLDGIQVFDEMLERDIVTWNALLTGCAQNGLGKEAVSYFEKLTAEGFVPNQITFLELLCACGHAGLVDEGLAYFNSMRQKYGIVPVLNHYTAVVDLLGRGGRLLEAESLIKDMPMQPDTVTWDALLAACRNHHDTSLGQRVAERLFHMGTKESGAYVLLSNIYASQGMWDNVRKVRETMLDREVNKEPGFSWIQIKNTLYSFLSGNKTCDHVDEIYPMLREFCTSFQAEGYIPETKFVLRDVEEEQKQNELLYHSEKIAVVFGILNTPNGSPVEIMKNLRICGDCHTFMKFLSKATHRKIIIRDGNRFHHFSEGFCSCGDYW